MFTCVTLPSEILSSLKKFFPPVLDLTGASGIQPITVATMGVQSETTFYRLFTFRAFRLPLLEYHGVLAVWVMQGT